MQKEEELRRQFGRRIRQLRQARGWTQRSLGDRCGMDGVYVGSVERGERNITLDNVERISKGFGVETHQLFLFSGGSEMPEERVTDAKVRDLLKNADSGRKQLMWRVIREIGGWDHG
jgi:transcriptional regulator with XRE-family HTH domain